MRYLEGMAEVTGMGTAGATREVFDQEDTAVEMAELVAKTARAGDGVQTLDLLRPNGRFLQSRQDGRNAEWRACLGIGS